MYKSITPILSIIASVILFLFFVQPLYQEVVNINEEIQEYKKTTNDYAVFTAELNELLSEKNTIRLGDKERLDRLVPNILDNPRILVDLERMARVNGLLFGNIGVNEGYSKSIVQANTSNFLIQSDVSQFVQTSNISFDLIGTYDQFKNFLKTLESSLTFMEVIEISFASSEGVFQQYSVTVQTYALPKL